MNFSNLLKTLALTTAMSVPTVASDLTRPQFPTPPSQSIESKLSRLIIIDPGHEEPYRTDEAKAARMLGQSLKSKLEKDSSYRVFLTRDPSFVTKDNPRGYNPQLITFAQAHRQQIQDHVEKYSSHKTGVQHQYWEMLLARAAIANQEWAKSSPLPLSIDADAFISLHYNESGRKLKGKGKNKYEPAHGFCVYVPSNELTNRVLHTGEDHQIQRIQESLTFGVAIRDALVRQGYRTSSLAHESAGIAYQNFFVLRAADCPSVLIESGFTFNPADHKAALNQSEVDKRAQTLSNAIHQYFSAKK